MLVLIRKEGTAIYGGLNLTEDIENTFDHKIVIEKIVDDLRDRRVTLSVTYDDGYREAIILDANNQSVDLDDGVEIFLMSIRAYPGSNGRDEIAARIGVNAPKAYKVVRDDAIKKTA